MGHAQQGRDGARHLPGSRHPRKARQQSNTRPLLHDPFMSPQQGVAHIKGQVSEPWVLDADLQKRHEVVHCSRTGGAETVPGQPSVGPFQSLLRGCPFHGFAWAPRGHPPDTEPSLVLGASHRIHSVDPRFPLYQHIQSQYCMTNASATVHFPSAAWESAFAVSPLEIEYTVPTR